MPIGSISAVIPARGSLLEHLENTTLDDPDFDSDEWNRQWALIEAEMKARELAHELQERLL